MICWTPFSQIINPWINRAGSVVKRTSGWRVFIFFILLLILRDNPCFIKLHVVIFTSLRNLVFKSSTQLPETRGTTLETRGTLKGVVPLGERVGGAFDFTAFASRPIGSRGGTYPHNNPVHSMVPSLPLLEQWLPPNNVSGCPPPTRYGAFASVYWSNLQQKWDKLSIE